MSLRIFLRHENSVVKLIVKHCALSSRSFGKREPTSRINIVIVLSRKRSSIRRERGRETRSKEQLYSKNSGGEITFTMTHGDAVRQIRKVALREHYISILLAQDVALLRLD